LVHLGRGTARFYPEVTYQTTGGLFERGTHGDFNGDGAVDLAYPNLSGGVTVLTTTT